MTKRRRQTLYPHPRVKRILEKIPLLEVRPFLPFLVFKGRNVLFNDSLDECRGRLLSRLLLRRDIVEVVVTVISAGVSESAEKGDEERIAILSGWSSLSSTAIW